MHQTKLDFACNLQNQWSLQQLTKSSLLGQWSFNTGADGLAQKSFLVKHFAFTCIVSDFKSQVLTALCSNCQIMITITSNLIIKVTIATLVLLMNKLLPELLASRLCSIVWLLCLVVVKAVWLVFYIISRGEVLRAISWDTQMQQTVK